MLNKRDLSAIKKALPENGYQTIADRISVSKETVRKVLNDPKRYNAEVISTSLQIIKEHKDQVESLKNLIKEI